MAAVDALLPAIAARAPALDAAAAFPFEDIDALRHAGLLAAPLPVALGGHGAGTEPAGADLALAALRALGRGHGAVARLWEAHVNALRLIVRHGTTRQVHHAAADALAGHLFGLWVTDVANEPPLTARSGHLQGRKGPCSGAGHCTRALVTVATGRDTRMAVIALTGAEPVVPIAGLLGMRAAFQGIVDLAGLPAGDWLGGPGDYLREPDFSTGAWRAAAAALGILEALTAATVRALTEAGRAGAPLQAARIGQLRIAQETARLWVTAAAARAEHPGDPADQVAYVNLARLAVEQAALQAITRAQRALGLAAFVAPHPVERLARDLATYLRQPAPDMVLLEAAAHYAAHWS